MPGTTPIPSGALPLTSNASFDADRPLLDDLQLEEAGQPDDFLRAVHVGHARQLHQIDRCSGPVARCFAGDAELVDAALEWSGIRDRFFAQAQLDVRLHRERVFPLTPESRSKFALTSFAASERRVLIPLNASTLNDVGSTSETPVTLIPAVWSDCRRRSSRLRSRSAAHRRSARAGRGARHPLRSSPSLIILSVSHFG